MPIPKPKTGEKQKDFHSRCIKEIINEYDDKQANAICYNTWEKKKENNMIISPYIETISKITGKKAEELQVHWDKAKTLTEEHFGIAEKDFKDKQYAYASEVVKELAGVVLNRVNAKEFVQSNKTADEYITETMTSGEFPKLNKDQVKMLKQDGTGPHGKGEGPGKGKADGSGLSDEEKEKSSKVVKVQPTKKEQTDKKREEREKYFGLTKEEYLTGKIDEGKENPLDTSNLKGMSQGLYTIDAPARVEIAQQWVEKGQPVVIQNATRDLGGKFTVEIRIPNTEKCTWYKFDDEAQAKKAGWLK